MAYRVFQSGVTGPSANIGGSSEYHIDLKVPSTQAFEAIRDRFDAIASKYKGIGRNIEFSNQGVGGEVYSLDSTPEERLSLLQRAAAAHAPRAGFHSFDYYAPSVGKSRFDSSAEGAPIFGAALAGSKLTGATGGNYGFHTLAEDADGNLLMKIGHGDDRSPGKLGSYILDGGELSDSDVAQSFLKNKVESLADPEPAAPDYADMSKEDINAAYDALRSSDPAKAREEGMKMHKAFFNK